MNTYHDPVLLGEVMAYWLNKNPGVYVDCTTGGGGHSEAILRRLSPGSVLYCLDRDAEAIHWAKQRLKPPSGVSVRLEQKPFSELGDCVAPDSVHGILYDLGVSSHQLDARERGFSFDGDYPLDLRMNRADAHSAQEWLRCVQRDELAERLRSYADLDRARSLAQRLLNLIAGTEVITAKQVRAAVEQTYPDRRRDWVSLYARVLQAIRMAINDELGEIERSLRYAVRALKSGGVLCVISYHSVEDRAVKTSLSVWEKSCVCPPQSPVCLCGGKMRLLEKMTRKPVLPSEEEIARNPRARSAKLRVYRKL